MLKVFCSGSCRILKSIHRGIGQINPIHSMKKNLVGVNFLGKLHNTKQHIQFLKFIRGNINLPNELMPKFLTSYNNFPDCAPHRTIPKKVESIRKEFDSCDVYVFEISSIKIYTRKGHHVQNELTKDYDKISKLSEADLIADFKTIASLIPEGKPIVLNTHFRPNVIFDDPSRKIPNREIIHSAAVKFAEQRSNTFIYDPSDMLKERPEMFNNENHLTRPGYTASYKYLYDHILSKIPEKGSEELLYF